ncbi:MAG: hypothetical protein Q8R67_17905 [Rhodoferax sp.]|nr:hypothetical protein [Rhodoferax sp.]MDP3653547.1 hypothetical protein [Rhodoferax sp.]
MTKVAVLATVALGLWVGAGYAHAHGDDMHAEASKAAHGGQVQVAGANHFELVVAKTGKDADANPVVVYLTDGSGKKLPSAGASGTATLLTGKDKSMLTLSPDGDNRMKGMGSYASAPGMKAIVSITFPGKSAEQARFTPLAAPSDGHSDHKH